jgi:vacuolar-type H+-ATPase subunit H
MARPAFPPPVQDVVELGRRVSHELLERSRKRITGARQGARQVLADARDTLHSARNHMQRAAMWRALKRRRRPT